MNIMGDYKTKINDLYQRAKQKAVSALEIITDNCMPSYKGPILASGTNIGIASYQPGLIKDLHTSYMKGSRKHNGNGAVKPWESKEKEKIAKKLEQYKNIKDIPMSLIKKAQKLGISIHN